MLSINMRIFKTVLFLVGMCSGARCLPAVVKAEDSEPTTASASASALLPVSTLSPGSDSPTDYYDQRQNGTENYRIHVDGLIVVVAPVEALLLAGAESSGITASSGTKPPIVFQPTPQGNLSAVNFSKPELDDDMSHKPPSTKFLQRSNMRLINLLAPLFRRSPE